MAEKHSSSQIEVESDKAIQNLLRAAAGDIFAAKSRVEYQQKQLTEQELRLRSAIDHLAYLLRAKEKIEGAGFIYPEPDTNE